MPTANGSAVHTRGANNHRVPGRNAIMNKHLEPAGRAVGLASLVAATMALGACGTAPSSLRPMASPASLQLRSPVKWTLSRAFIELHETLIAGTYVAVGESDEGTYY